MTENANQPLPNVLWIGGATDAGKTTVAQLIAKQYQLQVYHYDRYDFAHHYHLAQTQPIYRGMLNASLEEAWIEPTVEVLVERANQSFRDRFPLVIGDLCSLPTHIPIVAEGFGLTPELVAPVLIRPEQGIWLFPTPAFKQASMERRNKPSFRDQVGDPQLIRRKLYERDMLLAAEFRMKAQAHELAVFEVDGSQTAEEIAQIIARQYFR